MSGQDLQEHSYVKVLYDFQYKTAEGREISIKKNERLLLLQKTNADWWQVVRTWEQRSFYVPATYVREMSKSRKNSDEDRQDGVFEPPDGPKYKNMPKESHTSAMKNVKKWLAGAMDTKQETASKNSYSDESYKHNAMDYQSRAELKVGLAAIKSKSLERERKYGQNSDYQSDKEGSDRKRGLKKLPEEGETTKLTKSFSTSPKSFDIPSRMDLVLQDPFRKELESSLDRRRKISDSTDYDKLIRENREEAKNRRIRTRSSRSDDSQIDSDYDDKFDRRKIEKSVHEESTGRRRNSRSLELEAHQFQRTERSLSPKPTYGRQLTIAGQIPDDNEVEDDHRILNDKRRTWAVEELMSELTQMCKERGSNKKPNIQLKSTEIKATFDPLDKLTQELHEMNLMKSEGHMPTGDFKSSPMNVCKISINSEESTPEHKPAPLLLQPEEDDHSNLSETSDISTENSQVKRPKIRKKSPKSAFTFKSEVIVSTKPLKSPKSPKILDEYNEANILNDCFPDDSLNDARSLSTDKHKPYQELRHSSPEPERPCYSNIKPVSSLEKVKMRPKLKMKTSETSAELKLTPSLEKLASEIKFQPAKRTSDMQETKMSESDEGHYDDSGIQEGVDKSDDSWSRLDMPEPRNYAKFRHKLEYTGSFKTKREGKYFRRREDDSDIEDEADWRCGLKKSSTMQCATIPDVYRRFRRENNYKSSSHKRKSRSLSDLRCLEEDESDVQEFSPKKIEMKPVPLPRTKIPVTLNKIDGKIVPMPRKMNKREDVLSEDDVWIPRTDLLENKMHKINKITTSDIHIESSTAIGFKTLLCTSDSGSDNCLQSKELLSSLDNLDDHRSVKSIGKLKSDAPLRKDEVKIRESLSDELVLSSNASSEALQSQSESEVTAAFDASSQPSPINARIDQDSSYECTIDLPPGWMQKYDAITEQICFINDRGDRWFSSNDAEGKIYFFEENSNESSWVLPTITPGKPTSKLPIHPIEKFDRNSISTNDISLVKNTSSTSLQATQSFANRELPTKKSGTSLNDWPQLFDGNMRVLKEGVISRTKITENGKKLRKNWSTSYAVLTELFLLFFKDAKTFVTMMKSGQSSAMAKPDISVDLNGALIEPGERASSRKNVYMISTVLGLQVLIQSDNTALAAEWFQEIHGVIRKLPSSFKSQVKSTNALEIRKPNKSGAEGKESDESKRSSKIARSRSMKMNKKLDDSLEDLSGTVAERQTKIKDKLRKFFLRRPTVESLVKNGIYKDEPAFGSYLADVCPSEYPRVPLFVKTCIEVLESNEDNMKTDGLYRASGNLSQIQKIRLQVDQYNLSVLHQEEDVHVLTGALKLFFRELKEPLIPSSFFKEALNASMLKKTTAKVQCFRDIVKALPPPNHETLQFLLKHLLKVTSYQEYNRMHIPNLAIVFGPTLMWPAEESANMALDLMQQNLVIECLLSEYNKIFK